MFRIIGQSRAVQSMLVLQGAIAALILFPILSRERLEAYGSYISELSLIVLIASLLGWRGAKAAGKRERGFWLLLAGAYTAYLVTYLLYLTPDWDTNWTPTLSLLEDTFNLVFYIAIYLSFIIAPHSRKPWDISKKTRMLELTGAIVLAGSLITYFVLIPLASRGVGYSKLDLYGNTMFLYAALDVIVCTGFLILFRSSPNKQWRVIYLLLAAAAAVWVGLNIIEAFMYFEKISYSSGSYWDLLWLIPYLLTAVAVGAPVDTAATTVPVSGDENVKWRNYTLSRSIVVFYLAALPVLHFALTAINVLDPVNEMAREVCLVVSVLLLGGLSLWIYKRYREERDHVELQTRQIQKLEAIGQLSDGIAHEFNNLLTIVTGYTELILEDMDEQDEARPKIVLIHEAGEKAAALTGRIRNFSVEEQNSTRHSNIVK